MEVFTKVFLLDDTASGIESVSGFAQFSNSNIFLHGNKEEPEDSVEMDTFERANCV